ncbi:hypothetical protein K456DRAFT_1154985 [Colletotrichum gloeosporioides 23]|nr:hypothetical protein K456DRAFT_1154985 [Colletotrichum gloeosporioides 23]
MLTATLVFDAASRAPALSLPDDDHNTLLPRYSPLKAPNIIVNPARDTARSTPNSKQGSLIPPSRQRIPCSSGEFTASCALARPRLLVRPPSRTLENDCILHRPQNGCARTTSRISRHIPESDDTDWYLLSPCSILLRCGKTGVSQSYLRPEIPTILAMIAPHVQPRPCRRPLLRDRSASGSRWSQLRLTLVSTSRWLSWMPREQSLDPALHGTREHCTMEAGGHKNRVD